MAPVWSELQNRFQPNFRFRFRNLTTDDGLDEFSCRERKWGYGQVPRLLVMRIMSWSIKRARDVLSWDDDNGNEFSC